MSILHVFLHNWQRCHITTGTICNWVCAPCPAIQAQSKASQNMVASTSRLNSTAQIISQCPNLLVKCRKNLCKGKSRYCYCAPTTLPTIVFSCCHTFFGLGSKCNSLGVKGAKLGPAEKNCLKVGVKAQKIGRTRHANREIELLTSHKHNMNETEIYGGML